MGERNDREMDNLDRRNQKAKELFTIFSNIRSRI